MFVSVWRIEFRYHSLLPQNSMVAAIAIRQFFKTLAMMQLPWRAIAITTFTTLGVGLSSTPTGADEIIPAANGTDTRVTSQGPEHAITGGSLSADQHNLFHQFTEFNLSTGETATFLSEPAILNIFSGVAGGNPSLIDGLLQVSGSNANLFLISPNGILFGPNAALNLQGSFAAVTADQVNFADGVLDLVGSPNYPALVGEPQSFSFSLEQPGSVVNAGNLSVSPGESVVLMGGQVLNTGSVTAPGGNIVISAVEGNSLVRIAQADSLLNLEVATAGAETVAKSAFSPLSLPALLTGNAIALADSVAINPDGTIQLLGNGVLNTGSGTVTAVGLLDVAATQGGQVLVWGEQIALPAGLIKIGGSEVGGDLTVYANDDLTLGIAVDAFRGGHALFDPPTFTVNEPEAATIVSTLNSSGSATIEASEVITINAPIDNTSEPETPFGSLALTDENADGDLTINLNAPIRLSSTQFLTGDGSIVNVALTGLVQNGLSVAQAGATVNLATGTFQAGETLFLDRGLTLNGAGANNTILDGENEYSVLLVAASSDPTAGPVTISNLAIANGFAIEGDGGGIDNFGDLIINNSLIRDNRSSGGGGGINNVLFESAGSANSGQLTINNSTISGNLAEGDGGGIRNDGGSIFINNSTINNNQAFDDAGGIDNGINGGTVSIRNSTIANNSAAAAGGGVENDSFMTIANSTIVGNSATSGGGISNTLEQSALTLSNSLISGNTATETGANVFNGGTLSSENNLFGASGNAGIAGFSPAADDLVPDVGISQILSTVLADNGGPTQTLALVAGSPAIDRGSGSDAGTDQRGVPVFNGTRDIGAFEFVSSGGSGDDSAGDSDGDSDGGSTSTVEVECVAGDCSPSASSELSTRKAFGESSEVAYVEQFEEYLGVEAAAFEDLDALDRARNMTGVTPALVYAQFVPPSAAAEVADLETEDAAVISAANKESATDDDLGNQIIAQAEGRQNARAIANESVLQLVLVTANNEPQRFNTGATRSEVLAAARQLQIELTDRTRRRLDDYLIPAQALYGWLVAPLEQSLATEDIGHVSFVLDEGLRTLPLAMLHDGAQFIIENYSVGLMPSLSLTDTRIGNIRNAEVLAMGASEFSDQPPLPAVPLELVTINSLWPGETYLNAAFTPETLVEERSEEPYPVLHLATHGQFTGGGLSNSYIQFWNRRLSLDELPQLQLNNPTVELLVLSACRTVLGDAEAELGFAGLAIKSGAKSAIAALWQVSDLETAGLMAELYTHLGQVSYKAEALRQAQLSMLRGEVTIQDDNLVWSGGSAPLPDEFRGLSFADTRHPYYWSAFTLVGNPW